MKQISVEAFKEVVETERGNTSIDFINVCTPGEYREKCIQHVRNVPLDDLKSHLAEFQDKKTIYVHCRSGNRSQRAIDELTKLGVRAELVNVEGGLMAWDGAGFPTLSFTKRMPLMQQTLLTAGALVTIGVAVALFLHPGGIFLSLFVGLGLMFAGLTGWCGMSKLLSHMPWNKS